MVITDTDPTETRAAGSSDDAAVVAPSGLAGVFGSGDHKTLGRLYVGLSLTFGIAALALLAWFDLEAARDAADQTDRAVLNFTLSHLGLVFGFAIPLLLGLGMLVVPLQIGAATIAFPRAAAASLWGWVASTVLLAVTYLPGMDGGVSGGSSVEGLSLTYLALLGMVAALLLGTVCVVTTVVTLRPAGMSLDRVPLFSWSMLVAGGLWLLTLPVLAANALFILIDVHTGAFALFGTTDQQWSQLAWFVTTPQVFVLAIPVLGILGDVVATATGARQPQRGLVLTGIGAFGALGFGAYVQPAFNPGAHHQWPFVIQCALVILPLLLVAAALATTLRQQRPTLTSPLVLGGIALLLLVLGALASAAFGAGPLGLQSTSGALIDAAPAVGGPTEGMPIYTWGVFGLVLAAVVAGGVAGVVHWSAKLTGRSLPGALGNLLALMALAGGLLLGGPRLVLGFATKSEDLADSATLFFVLSLAGALVLLAVAAIVLALTVGARAAVARGGATAEPDPWGTGVTLEWATDSPPPPGNIGTIPVVESPEPLLDRAGGES